MRKGNGNGLLLAAAGAGALLAARELIRRSRRYDMRGRVVLITGGSRGLGLVLARELAREGARLAICARDAEELDRARHDLEQRGAAVYATACDVTNQFEVEGMVREVTDHYGRIDVLINNAGVIEVGPMEVMTLRDYEHAMKTHFWGPLYSVLAVLPHMKERGEGRIVNISSIGGKISVPHLLPYSASKFALVGLSEGLRAELAKDGIVVTTVCPGLMRTGSPRNAVFKGQHKAEYAWFTISDSLPVTSMRAERAARQVIAACKRGDAEVVLSIQAKLAALFHGVFPGVTADLLGLANRLLPGPGGIGKGRALGEESQSALAPSFLTALSDQAARENNEIAS
ncbi:MAG TPA: SDR family NAD(P)-dependent oxidoreductase [Blastocatellia bacterium]|nr:SDR family NAD(P)-dependent oxidoreductase [Blastocatellia bacterium]